MTTTMAPIAEGREAAGRGPGGGRVVIEGEAVLIERLGDPLQRALEGRGAFYKVRVDWVGRRKEVVVSITSSKGRLPLIFDSRDLERGHVLRVVRANVEKHGL